MNIVTDDERRKENPRPIALDVIVATIPERLRNTPHWLAWSYEWRADRKGNGKWTKVPKNAHTGRNAQSNNPRTWATFNAAWARYRMIGVDGIGIVPRGDLVAVDLDHCRGRETGEIKAWARAIVAKIDSYTEISPSGTGLRILASGTLPPGRRKVGDVEMYDMSSPKYLSVTGHHLEGTPLGIESRQEAIEAVHAEHLPGGTKSPRKAASGSPSAPVDPNDFWDLPAVTDAPEDDETILEFARMSPNGAKFRALWEGRLDFHGDDASAADLALCALLAFWSGPDPQRIDRMFRKSGLFRDKWEGREYYRRRTVVMAISADRWFDWSGYWTLLKQEQVHAAVAEFTIEEDDERMS